MAAGEAAVDITTVECVNGRGSDELLGSAIDLPAAPSRYAAFDFVISGWALTRKRGFEVVQVRAGDEVIARARQYLPSAEAASKFPRVARAQNCGFQIAVGTVGLAPRFECVVEGLLPGGRAIALWRVRGTRTITTRGGGAFRPAIVTSLGRTGTTLLLGLLAGHPEIVVEQSVPHEERVSSYWLQVFKVLSRPTNPPRGEERESFTDNPQLVGRNPYNYRSAWEPGAVRSWFGQQSVEHLATFCRENIDAYYGALAESYGKPHAHYFAEKILGNPIPHLWRDVYVQEREIFLVRDFRDMTASILAFNMRRGTAAFGRDGFRNDEAYVRRHLGGAAQQLLEAWRERGQNALLVRYEDLIGSQQETLQKLLEFLEVDSGETAVDRVISSIEGRSGLGNHQTTAPAASVGRWQTDLTPRLQQVCAEAFGPFLPEFGYA